MNIVKANTLDDALRLINDGYCPLAGATNVYVDKKKGKLRSDKFVDVSSIGLDYIKETDDGFYIGALATFDAIERYFKGNEDYVDIYLASFNMGGPQIRNKATLAGNIADCSPAADGAGFLLVNDAVVNVSSIDGAREIDIKDFFLSFRKTALNKNELITSFFIKKQHGKGWFEKVGLRNAMAISVASITLKKIDDKIKVAVGSLSPVPKRLYNVENYINTTTKPSEQELESVLYQDVSPITDIRATAEYRRTVCKNVLKSALKEVFDYEF